jgi:tetratricopeptide (TPR) repeat protein
MSKRKHAIEAYFQSGVRLQGAGRLAEAEQVYRQILAAAPGHADSLHMLGVIASQCGQPQAAVACIDQAIAIKPSVAMFHVNRAAALLTLRQLDAALAGCQAALRLQRNSAATPCNASPACRTCTTTWVWCCGRRIGWRRLSSHFAKR